jgi:hypothetical protein
MVPTLASTFDLKYLTVFLMSKVLCLMSYAYVKDP